MTSQIARANSPEPLSRLNAAALIAVLAGAAGSLGLMFYAGHRNRSVLLLGLFALWVLYPYAAFLYANKASKRWPALTRTALYIMTIVVALGSLITYAGVTLRARPVKIAFVFLVVPAASGLLTAAVVAIAALLSRRARLPH
jgi:hypothetical protein